MPRKAKPWFRSDRNPWYATTGGKQTPLGVFGPENEAAAGAAPQAIRSESRRHPTRLSADLVRGLLPAPVLEEPVTGGVLLTGGDPGLVAIRVTDEGLTVAVAGVRWDGTHAPVRDDRELGILTWGATPADTSGEVPVAIAPIQAAVVVRRSRFRDCRLCHASKPPEWMHGDVCHSCAEMHLGVVH